MIAHSRRHRPSWMRSRNVQPSHCRHDRVEDHQAEGLAGLRGAIDFRQGRRPVGRGGRPHSVLRQQLVVRRRGSGGCRPRPAPADACEHAATADSPACASRCGRPNSAVKWNVLPRPTSLSTQMSPAHQAHQLRGNRQSQSGAAESPRGRAIGLAERLEDVLLFVGGDADARVVHGAVQSARLDRCRSSSRTSTNTSPRSVNLMALPTRLTRSAAGGRDRRQSVAGTSAATRKIKFEALFGARGGPATRVASPTTSRRSKAMRLQLHLARLDLGEVEDVVDQAQQAIGRLLDDVQIVAAARRRATWSAPVRSCR